MHIRFRRSTPIHVRAVAVAVALVSTVASAQDPSARLRLHWDRGAISVTDITVYDTPAAEPLDTVPGQNSLLQLSAGSGPGISVPLRVPNRLYYDYGDPVTGVLGGGAIDLDTVDFSVVVPWKGTAPSVEMGGRALALPAPRAFGASKALLPTQKIVDNGPDSERVVFAVMGDGYTLGQLGQFHATAANVMGQFLAEPPWDEYASYVNVYTIDVVSAQSGADHPNDSTFVNTALDASYGLPPVVRLLTVNQTKALDAAESVPTYTFIMVIVNDPEYGGSGGSIGVISRHSAAVFLALHEMGHTFAHLADEYDDPCPDCDQEVNEPNATETTVRAQVPWVSWIDPGTPVPTPEIFDYSADVGVFEGAHYQPSGVYRPKQNCEMRALGAGFCEVCTEAHVLSLYSTPGVRPVRSADPDPAGGVPIVPGIPMTFSLDLHEPASAPVSVEWFVDDVPVDGESGPALEVDTSLFASGNHTVSATVRDATSLVRNDSLGLLDEEVSWVLETAVPTHRHVEEGETLRLDIPGNVNEQGSIQWYKAGMPLIDDERIDGATTGTLIVTPVSFDDAGAYAAAYDDGAKSAQVFGPVNVTVVGAGLLPLLGALGMGILLGVLAALGALAVWRANRR